MNIVYSLEHLPDIDENPWRMASESYSQLWQIFSIEALHRLRLDLVPFENGSRILLITIQPDR